MERLEPSVQVPKMLDLSDLAWHTPLGSAMSSFSMVESLYPMLPVDNQPESSRSTTLPRMNSRSSPFPAPPASTNPAASTTYSPVRSERPVQSADMSNYKIVLGYDFGTTYSGASYAYCQNEEILDVQRWYVLILEPTLSRQILMY